jgi:hypothetical protein
MGWVAIPLHHDDDFRKEYNQMKNKWINKEISGRSNERSNLHSECARLLLQKYPQYFKMNEGGKFDKNPNSQGVCIKQMFMDGITTSDFNETEKYEIVLEARFIVEEMIRRGDKTFLKKEKKKK